MVTYAWQDVMPRGLFLPEHQRSRTYSARFNNCYPVLQSAFTGTHSGLSRLSSYRFVRENFDPNFTTTFDVTGHSDTGCLDLIGFDPARLKGYETKFTVVNFCFL